MDAPATPNIYLSVDLKKNRIRIHKAPLHQMGDPPYIQLLVNPERMEVAIRGVDYDAPQVQAHKVSQSKMLSDFSYEIYSMAFVKKLCALIGDLDTNCSYRMAGTLSPEKRLAIFSLKTLKRIEG